MAGSPDSPTARRVTWAVGAAVLLAAGWAYPPFHVVKLAAPTRQPSAGPTPTTGAFDAKAVAAKLWREPLPAAEPNATALAPLLAAIRSSPDAAKAKYGKNAGVGSVYYFVRGRGRVVARERTRLVLSVDGTAGERIALRTGPVFGNTVRDGCGLLNLNAFPGLAEFNALSTELNALVEQEVLPPLRQSATVGTGLGFTGCAEAPDEAADPGEPVLTVVPVAVQLP